MANVVSYNFFVNNRLFFFFFKSLVKSCFPTDPSSSIRPLAFLGRKWANDLSIILSIFEYGFVRSVMLTSLLQWNLDLTKSHGLSKFVRYNGVSLCRGSFSYILLLLGKRKSFVLSRTLLCRGLLNRSSTVLDACVGG